MSTFHKETWLLKIILWKCTIYYLLYGHNIYIIILFEKRSPDPASFDKSVN